MSKKRGLLVWSLLGLATILMFVSSLTVWSKRQLLDDQAWADSSTQLLANDEVRAAIAQKLTDALFQRVDVEAQLRERLPAQRKGTAVALAAALQNTVVPAAADRLLQRPRVQTLWENAQQAGPRRCREGAGGRGPGQERKHLDRERSGHPGPETGDHEAGDTARVGGQAEGKRRSERRPARDHEVGPARRRPDGGEDPQGAELAAPARRLRPLRTGDLPRAGAAQAAAGRERGEPHLRRPGARLAPALPRRRDRGRARQDGGEQASGERDLGDRDERAARHRDHPGRLRRARPRRDRPRRPESIWQSPSGARSHLPSEIIRSSSGRPLSSCS